jgi:hypothetical protein
MVSGKAYCSASDSLTNTSLYVRGGGGAILAKIGKNRQVSKKVTQRVPRINGSIDWC